MKEDIIKECNETTKLLLTKHAAEQKKEMKTIETNFHHEHTKLSHSILTLTQQIHQQNELIISRLIPPHQSEQNQIMNTDGEDIHYDQFPTDDTVQKKLITNDTNITPIKNSKQHHHQ